MKLPFRLLGTSALILGALLISRAGVAADYNYTYVIGKGGNRARNAQILRNEAMRRQQQQLQQQQQQKAQQEQAAAATSNQSAAPVPNPPDQSNPFSPPNRYYVYRQIMPVSTNAAPKTKAAAQTEEGAETLRSVPVSESPEYCFGGIVERVDSRDLQSPAYLRQKRAQWWSRSSAVSRVLLLSLLR